MSVWDRVRGLFGIQPPEAASEEARADELTPGEAAPVIDRSPTQDEEDALAALARGPSLDDAGRAQALELFERIREAKREPVAIDLGKRLLAAHRHSALRARLGFVLDARGDDEGARAALAPLCGEADAPLDALMLAAELEERRGADAEALILYERVVARDVDHPRARARALRLAEGRDSMPGGGATVMVEGALAKGRYRVTRELGRGGAGTVFLARDASLGRDVALKVYHRRGRADRERLVHEARVAASMEHPGVVRVLDVELALGAISMELMGLGSVRSELNKGSLPRARALRWMLSATDALRFVHGAGYVHRDLKPSNLLLREGDRVALTDFGIALRAGARPEGPGGAEGTAAYMAPEQHEPGPATIPMDVHALGATLREVTLALQGGPVASLLEISDACMRRDPRARPSLGQVDDALRAALKSESTGSA